MDPPVARERRCTEGDTGRRGAFVAERGEAEFEVADGGFVLLEADAVGDADAAAQAVEIIADEVAYTPAEQHFGRFTRCVWAGRKRLSREPLIEGEPIPLRLPVVNPTGWLSLARGSHPR